MKILVVSQYFYPENFRINELCKTLKENGHDITVLTGKPNYPKGKIYDSYSKFGNDDEVWEDIRIIRAPLLPRGTGGLKLILNYFSFAYFGTKRAKKLKNIGFDVIYVFEVSPITVAYPAIALKKRTGTPIIMNVQDLWPDNIVAVTGVNNKLVLNIVDRMVNSIYSKCDLILTASQSFVSKVQDRVEQKDKVIYWPQYSNVARKLDFQMMFDIKKFNIVFTGNIGVAQNLELVIESADILRDSNICWHLVGNGRNKENLVKKVNEMQLQDSVKFYEAVEENLVPDYLQSADVALLILSPDPIFDMTLPAKLQTYMACGCPILGCTNGESKRVIEGSNAGITCETLTVGELVKKAIYMSQLSKNKLMKYGENARIYNDFNFSKNKLLDSLIMYMNKL